MAKQELSKHFKSVTVEIKRSQIKLANYNPRKISEKNLARIRKNIKGVGLLGGLIWNALSGNLVSGHQRLSILDQLEKYDGKPETDYIVKVEKVELDNKAEVEQNIFMNSQSAQGEYDYDILAELLPSIDPVLAGLDENDLNLIVAESPMYDFGDTEDVQDDIKELEAPYEARKAAIKEMKAKQKEALNDKFEGDPYFTVSFDNYENKAEFMERLGYKADDKFIKGELLFNKFN